ncbi:MAG: AzlC family ABC transporter permease [Phyllobacteriaceae bacterium]|nr:AzlC family ABC transporter permease [Phyllobacteriaceae bacterium]
MSESARRAEIIDGLKASFPVVVSSAPFGMLFGALAVKNGLTIGESVAMSATVYAGASQMVGIELFGKSIAPWLVVLSIFAVNFRHVLYSASVGRRLAQWPALARWAGFFFLVDPQYAEAERRGEQGLPVSPAWYFAMAAPIYVFWFIDTWIGATFGALIKDPHGLGLDFLLPLYFLGMVMGFRQRPLWLPIVAASGVASVVAWHVVGSPWHVSIGALAGVALAALLAPDPGRPFA